jgi:lipopolysaccharide transport protein LptA
MVFKLDGKRAALLGLALAAAVLPALTPPRAQAQVGAPEKSAAQEKVQYGFTTVLADNIDYDLSSRRHVFTGHVKLTTKDTEMTADAMTVQFTMKRELEWSKCEGNVFVEKKNQQDGTSMTARGRTLEYYDQEQKANIKGDVVVYQSSPRLAKPAMVTGSRVDMDLKTKQNVVFKSADSQAKVHVEPKGEPGADAKGQDGKRQEGKPEPKTAAASGPPEPVDLVGDRIEMNSATQQYVATGSPVMVRPTSRLEARKIHFQVEEKGNDVKVAYADDDVVFDGQGQNGSVMHATGDHGVYTRDINEIVLTGTVHATTKDPGDDEPSVWQGDKFVYNTLTRAGRLLSLGGGKQVQLKIPGNKVPGGKGDKPAGADAGEGDSKKK